MKKVRRVIDTSGAPRPPTHAEWLMLHALRFESGKHCLCFSELAIHLWLTGSKEGAPTCVYCQRKEEVENKRIRKQKKEAIKKRTRRWRIGRAARSGVK